MRLEVNTENYYRRLDKFLRNQLKNIPLSTIYKLIRKGKVYVNGKRVRDPSFDLEEGDVVELRYVNVENLPKREKKENLVPIPMQLDVVYESEDYLVVNKPAGIPMHPGKGVHVATLIEGLLYYGEKKGFVPYLVHRIDMDTSGLLLVAKSKEAARVLSQLFREKKMEKLYLTLVKGQPPEKGTIEIPLDGSPAVTEYWLVRSFDEVSFLKVKIITGKKHQIRRHLAGIGYPIVEDNDYGDRPFNREFRKRYGLKRMFLHSYSISFRDPWDNEERSFVAKLPPDLLEVLFLLEKGSTKWLEEFFW